MRHLIITAAALVSLTAATAAMTTDAPGGTTGTAHAAAAIAQSPLHAGRTLLRATGDIRMRNSDSYRSRPDRSVHRELEDFVDTLSGIELVLLVLAIVIPVSALTPLLAILILGGRCDKCGRHHAMHVTHRETLPYDGTVTRRGRPVHKRIVTRVCRHCGHTDTIGEADH